MKNPKSNTVSFQPSARVKNLLKIAEDKFGSGVRSKLINQTLENGLQNEFKRLAGSLDELVKEAEALTE